MRNGPIRWKENVFVDQSECFKFGVVARDFDVEMGGDNVRLYANGTFIGYRRGQHTQYHNTALIQIDGVQCPEDASFYNGKRVAYVYKASTLKNGTKMRVKWGKIVRPHGNSGIVRAKFVKSLPAQAMGCPVRVMLYPSTI